jgi:uncharacterized protein YbbC (DUF1343 family)
MFRQELFPGLELEVVTCEGWTRSQLFDETGLTWTNPSPNMRNLNQALLYPGVGLVELTNISVGRGTDTPFEIVGAPWIQERQLAAALNAARLQGIRFVPVRFTPSATKYPGESCGGVQLIITSRTELEPIEVGIQLMCTLRELYPEDWDTKNLNRLLASSRVGEAIMTGEPRREILGIWKEELRRFVDRRSGFLLYP